jgi:hypothetical protein
MALEKIFYRQVFVTEVFNYTEHEVMDLSNIREILTCSLSASLILGLCSLTRFLAFLHVKLFTSRTPAFSFRFAAKRLYKLGWKNIKASAWHVVSGIDFSRKKSMKIMYAWYST